MLYEHLFWFYGHPVVYIMFFPFIGAVAEVVATFAGRRFFGYKGTALALLVFAAGSMAVWGHHMFASHQVVNDYFSVTSNFLAIPAGVEYFGLLATLIGARLRYSTAMLFALAFIPQFLIGGAAGPQLRAAARPARAATARTAQRAAPAHGQRSRRRVAMRVSAALVVAFWGIVNGLLVAMLAGFGEQSAVLALYGGAAALVGLIAIAVWAGTRRRRRLPNPARPNWHPANGDGVVILAIGILVAALGVAYYPYLALAAVPPVILFAVREMSARKSRKS